MKLHVLSDIHLEFQKWPRDWDLASIDCDVHILAGDIGSGFQGLDFALKRVGKPAIYICGNHELYGKRTVRGWWHKAREKLAGSPVHLLENESIVIGDVRFLGCTLWTDFALLGDERQEAVGRLAEREMSDFGNIFLTRRGPINFDADPYAFGFTRRRSGDRLTLRHVAALHRQSRDFLEAELHKVGPWNKTVVVTHHAPSVNGIEQESADELDAAYASHLDSLVARADLWIHGHVHRAREYAGTLGGRVVQNARGYADSGLGKICGFQWNKVIEL
jgi:predicted phosphodiesterase